MIAQRARPRACACGRALHMKAQNFIKGALIISVGGLVAKILGALYRIPLTNMLGGEGMGIYQMVYPLYCLLLTLSATGIPSGLARIVAQSEARGERSRSAAVLRRALFLFSAIGLLGSAVMFFASPVMSGWQREAGASHAYRMLAPSVFFVSVISCYRGYFQGKGNFLPTALSEIFEQAVKISLGLYFAYTFRQDPAAAVAYALLAVTVSEALAAAFMIVWGSIGLRGMPKPLYRERAAVRAGSLLRFILPVAIAAGVLPLSNMIDSIIIVNLIGRYAENATALYGVFSGGANTLVNLPVSLCYGLAAAVIPLVSSLYAKGMAGEAEKKICFALKCTFFVSVPAAAFLFAFPSETCAFLFRSVTGEEGAWLVRLVRIMSFGAVLLSPVQALSACLTGRGKPKIAALSMSVSVAVKIALEFLLVKIPKVSVAGAAIAAICCYFVALLVNLLYSIRDKSNFARMAFDLCKFAGAAAVAVGAAYPLRFAGALALLGVSAAVYIPLCLLLKCFSREELGMFGRRKNYDHDNRAGVRPGRSHGGRKGSDPFRR